MKDIGETAIKVDSPLMQAFILYIIIMPITDVDGYPEGHFNRVYNHIISPACKMAGYEVVRADATAKSNVIIADILKNVLDCEMAICDLSARNPNVFYELGFRQAFNKKTVLMIDNKTDRPFDISGLRSFMYDSSLRIDLVNKAINDLVKALDETSEMGEHELNSLLKLLSIENPATLPEGHKLSDDSTLILQAIDDLQNRLLHNPKNSNVPFYRDNIFHLPNGIDVSVGDTLMYKDTDRYREYGNVVSINKGVMFVESSGRIKRIDQVHPDLEKLTTMPF